MRAVLCTSGGVPGALVLEQLRAGTGLQIVGVVRSTRILSPRFNWLRGAWMQYRRSGLRYAAYLGFALLRPMASEDAPVLRTRDVNSESALAFVARQRPQLIVSAFFNQRIGQELAGLARHGAVNIHPSLLPAFKGVDPVFYSRLRGSPFFGVTLHRVSPELDAGAVLAQRSCAVPAEESVLATTARLYASGARLLAESLGIIAQDRPGIAQSGPGEYDSWPSRTDVTRLRRAGVKLVSWRDLRLLAP